MSAVTATTGAAPGPEGQEVRLALVMTGGISLAVWIGGVTAEVFRALESCRAGGETTDLYRELFELTKTTLTVDLASGASAGGLNGVLLATALARGVSVAEFDDLRNVWLDDGAFENLLRSPFEHDPPSLLKGDEYLLVRLRRVLRRWIATHDTAWRAYPPTFDLLVPVTLLDEEPRTFRDDLDEAIVEPDHRGLLHFTATHLGAPEAAGLLARAGRTTASFPAAFEASLWDARAAQQVSAALSAGPIANFAGTRYAIDGGVLANKPIRPALNVLFGRDAAHEVRRVVAYVNPAPGTTGGTRTDAGDTGDARRPSPPSLAQVLVATATLPSKQSIAEDLDELTAYNDRVRRQAGNRSSVLATADAAKLVAIAADLYRLFLDRHGAESVQRMLDASPAAAATTIAAVGPGRWNVVVSALAGQRRTVLPDAFPTSGNVDPGGSGWPWGIAPVEYAVSTGLDLVRRAFAVALPVRDREARGALGEHRRELHRLRAAVARVRALDTAYWDVQLPRLAAQVLAAPPPADVASPPPSLVADRGRWALGPADAGGAGALAAAAPAPTIDGAAADAYEQWPGPDPRAADAPADGSPLARAAAALLAEIGDQAGAPDPADRPWKDVVTGFLGELETRIAEALLAMRADLQRVAPAALAGMVAALTGPDGGRSDAAEVVRRLLALYVIQVGSCADSESCEQPMALAVVSAAVRCELDPARDLPSDKLTGLQLHHFGAFFKESWRANDWLWGRLDGSARLIQILLDPDRLRVVSSDDDATEATPRREAFLRIARLALGPPDAPERALTERTWNAAYRNSVWRELAYLDDPSRPVPKSLRWSARAVAFRRQLSIAAEELPRVADAVTRSARDGGAENDDAYTFAGNVRAALGSGATVAPADVPKLFAGYHVGEERLEGEIGYDLFTRTTSTALAVGASALNGTRSGLGSLRNVFKIVRTIALALYVLAQSATRASKAAFAATTLLLAFGASVIALRLLTDSVPDWLAAIAGLALALWVLLSTCLARAWLALGPLLVAGVVVAATFWTVGSARIVVDGAHRPGWKVWLHDNAGWVGRATGAVLALCLASWAWRTVRRHRDVRRVGVTRVVLWSATAAVALLLIVVPTGIVEELFYGDAAHGWQRALVDTVDFLHRGRVGLVLIIVPAALVLVELLRRGVLAARRRLHV